MSGRGGHDYLRLVQTSPIESFAPYFAEYVGTFVLSFAAVSLYLTGVSAWASTGLGFTLAVLVYAFGNVSAAAFNPAVSLAMGLSGHVAWKDVGFYAAAQFAGGLSAGLCTNYLVDLTVVLNPEKTNEDVFEAVVVELLLSTILTFVTLNVRISPLRNPREDPLLAGPLAIGFAKLAVGYSGVALSGGIVNPAICMAFATSGASHQSVCLCFGYMPMQFVGATLACSFYRMLRPEDCDQDRQRILTYGTVSPRGSKQLRQFGQRLAAENLGTMVITVVFGLCNLNKQSAAPWAVGAANAAVVYSLGDISGGLFNPAVTLAAYLSSRLTRLEAIMYGAVQMLGGSLGVFIYMALSDFETVTLGPTARTETLRQWLRIGLMECLYTAALAFVVLSVRLADRPVASCLTQQNNAGGLAVGCCVAAGGICTGKVCEGILNPAISLTSGTVAVFDKGHIAAGMLYTVFELCGGLLAAGLFLALRPEAFRAEVRPKDWAPA